MKKRLSVFLATVCMTLMLFPAVASYAASASLTGPGTVRAGDTITLTLSMGDSSVSGQQGTISYDKSQLTLKNVTKKVPSSWQFTPNEGDGKFTFTSYDVNDDSPISGSKAVLTATFAVNATLETGTVVTVTASNLKVSADGSSVSIGNQSYSCTIAAPKSSNANLRSLSASNATLSPAFGAGTTSYTAIVPYEVNKLNITAVAEDAKATVSVNSPQLTPNADTNVIITVTAENGAKKTYTIRVHREQDPEYVPHSNNDAAWIKADGYVLSPAFSAEETEYVVWLPCETESLKVTAAPADPTATVEVNGGDNLQLGEDNPIQVIITAENGDKKVYTVIAKRAQSHNVKPVAKSDDASLKSLAVFAAEMTPEFSPDTTLYDVYIPGEVEGFFASFETANGANARFDRDVSKLPTGNSTVTITVTAEDGVTTRDYIFNVTHGEEEIIPDPTPQPRHELEFPWWLLLIAFVLGCITGYIIKRSGDEKKTGKNNNGKKTKKNDNKK